MNNPSEFFGPTPPFNNPPIEPQFFKPSQFFISAIVLGQTTTITTTTTHNYVVGQQVRLLIPEGFGSRQLNEQFGYIINIPSSTQFTLDLSSYNVDPFVNNPNFTTKPQTVAMGDVNTGLISNSGRSLPTTTIPGSFQNISPL